MAFFSLTDIKIKDPETNFKPNSVLSDQYMSNVLRYPLDIGSLDKGHYMVIHVNQQVKSRFKAQTLDDEANQPTILQNQKNTGNGGAISTIVPGLTNIANDINNTEIMGAVRGLGEKYSSILSEKYDNATDNMSPGISNFVEAGLEGIQSAVKGVSKVAGEVFDLTNSGKGLRTIKRTTDSIAFYMPDTLNFTNNQQYSTMEFGASPLSYLAAATAGYSQIKESNNKIQDTVKNLTPFILNNVLRNKFQNAGAGLFAAGTGTVINPQLEMIYSSPSFREFRFDFMLYPRSSKEALEVQKILNRLRFHQAPEVYKEGAGALGGFFLVPPSEFDIEFYYNGRVNPNIPKISTCVLTSIDTDYAPNGWSAYEVPNDAGTATLGKTGMPVGIRLSLNFQETEIMTKDNFYQEGNV